MRRPARWFGRALALVVILVVGLTAVTAVRIVLVAREDDRTAADTVVVLGAAQYDGEPQAYLTARLEHARDLYAERVAPRVVTVGGSAPGDRYSEAEAGAAWLADNGVPAEDVLEVPRGGNTLASMSAVSLEMRENGWTSAVVVTDPWHTLRSTEMLEQQGVDATGSPTRTGPANGSTWTAIKYVTRETAAYLAWLAERVANRVAGT